mmetsp:Transcript_20873/g.26962  ORF Transcript_20873/g.26962 Transcript_20873/m.26962 type:complete len:421 (-) Transcript_20873:35-1297(-)
MPKKKTTSAKKLRKSAAAPGNGSNATVKELVEAAEHAMQSQNAHQAIAFYNAALDVTTPDMADMDATFVLEKRAEAKVSISDPDGARDDFAQALHMVREQQPSNNNNNGPDPSQLERMASLLLYMGQSSGGNDALLAYVEGISMLKSSLEIRQQDSNSFALDETRKQVAAACCSAAEVYLTDLCDEGNAEQECDSFVQQALSYVDQDGSPIIDALQTAASLLFSQCKGLEAVKYMQQCYAKIQTPCEALSKLVDMYIDPESSGKEPTDNVALELTQVEAAQSLPGFEFRCQSAKLLLEGCDCLSQDKPDGYETTAQQCAVAAIHILGSLMAENDEVIEIWFLAGDAYVFLKQPAVAQQYYQQTVQMFEQVQQSLEEELETCDDEQQEEELQLQVDEVTCQLEDVRRKLQETSEGAESMEE